MLREVNRDEMYLTAITTIIGVLIGSFLNVCIIRIPKKESIVYPPSHCTSCGAKLKSSDLIPIFSYMHYKGKCIYCQEKISIQYLITEILTGIIFLLSYIRFGLSVEFVFYTMLFCILIIISGIDYSYQIIPDDLILLSFVLGITFKLISYLFLGQAFSFFNSFLGIVVGGGFLLFISIISNGGMGGGDIKLMAVLGLWIGWKYTILALLLSFIFGGILSLVLLLLKIKSRGEMIPFGPFLALGFLVTVLYGKSIIIWYMNAII
ncbi:prepilin peptidase [Brassicibacter mesophilus]|uniref:prepilin peptidase n=1 Tax=Brassicibacter mesophilus TaxID=745119 RepID=UPI003D1E4E12